MKKFLISSALIGILFTGLLNVEKAHAAMNDSGTFYVAEKAINI
ncbi:hypothetical protein [Bacillus atrophaeus]|jgi:hypothetical protein|nr:hypothetical protein [Bacillus atrophaeus]MEC0649262.1 hypothetical protein [Bacillus atrophaeus]MEC0695555.1 hypothetical protein [Bacillus atrophaeus]MEC1902009.1 hypothetical protein [Bacillus atrophaeus]MEC2397889.1 hypothetical protein [Bacillus atrophaeus]MEC5219332.1 hypothetical protein [Bacillus atrophaeus]